jgi:DNA-binding MarR family transcriptional regulator
MIRPGRREPHRLPGQYAARVSNGRMTASAPDRTATAGRADPAGQADPADRAVTVTADVGPPTIDVTRLRVAIARVSRSLRRHELAGLTPTQLSALATVEQAGPLRLGDLAAAEKIAPSTLTRLVTVLEERGYVARQPVPGDARASTLVITPEGHAILEQIRRESTILLADNLRTLSPDELTALAAALPALERIANPSPPDARHR